MLQPPATVATPWWARALVWTGLPLVGAGLGRGLVRLAGALAELWVPFRGVFRVVRDLPEPHVTIGAVALGAVAGLVLAYFVDQESLTVRLSPAEIVLSRPGATRTVARADVAVAFRDRDRLVLLGRTGRELAHEPCHLSPGRLAPAFAAQGVPWAEQDPYADSYRRWVPGLPDVPEALFVARDKALRSGDTGDADDLRAELGRLGYVLRDDRKRQYFRRVGG